MLRRSSSFRHHHRQFVFLARQGRELAGAEQLPANDTLGAVCGVRGWFLYRYFFTVTFLWQ
ncbi:MAG: hypothetical protein SFU87_19005 [Chitinophagaceae bacterium]|nr:hypothetical protein [Chitinophagaceae bacterium]